MDHHPPEDRRISSGAVAAAWAMVAGLVAVMLLVSTIAPSRPTQIPLAQQAALPSGGCTNDEGTADRPDRSMRD